MRMAMVRTLKGLQMKRIIQMTILKMNLWLKTITLLILQETPNVLGEELPILV